MFWEVVVMKLKALSAVIVCCLAFSFSPCTSSTAERISLLYCKIGIFRNDSEDVTFQPPLEFRLRGWYRSSFLLIGTCYKIFLWRCHAIIMRAMSIVAVSATGNASQIPFSWNNLFRHHKAGTRKSSCLHN